MTDAYLLLGTNMGNREYNISAAIDLIESRCGKITAKSSLYETEAWGLKEQSDFLNTCICINTQLLPTELLSETKKIESELGRKETTNWGPRIIDIDILFFGNEIVNLPDLKIPHPYIIERRFTLLPLVEIAPGFIHPQQNKTLAELLELCTDQSSVTHIHS
jgi:2-amino-4-hydroxy-6-hydroxymethyldihydropteridine diphosphokinase